MLEENDELCM